MKSSLGLVLNRLKNYLVWNLVHRSSGNSRQFSASEVFVEDVVGHLLQVLQVRPDQHVAQGNEVAVLHVFNLKIEF